MANEKTKIAFDASTFRRFKVVYQTAKQNNIEVFVFDGNEFKVGYAKYLIEYLTPKFPG